MRRSLYMAENEEDQQAVQRYLGLPCQHDATLATPSEVALLDVWTAPTDPRLQHLRQEGTKLSCLADLLLEREDCIGITGSAGKTTATTLAYQLLAAHARVPRQPRVSLARAANLWPRGELLANLGQGVALLELTSSHLAFCHHSPAVAAITNLWPDHLELHGGWQPYRQAKAGLFRWQGPQDYAVLPAQQADALALANGCAARKVWFSRERSEQSGVERVWIEAGRLRCQQGSLGELPPDLDGLAQEALLCAMATAVAAALRFPEVFRYPQRVPQLNFPPHRRRRWGRVIDDSMAATPRKAQASLHLARHVVVGGRLEVAGQRVHASPEEAPLMESWLESLRASAERIELFGSAGEMLQAQVPGARLHRDLASALRAALACSGDHLILVAPGFPLDQQERLSVASIATAPSTHPTSVHSHRSESSRLRDTPAESERDRDPHRTQPERDHPP